MIIIGEMLRDERVTAIDALDWADAEEAARVRAALVAASLVAPGELQMNDDDWSYDFLRDVLKDCVEEDLGHVASSRGFCLCATPIGQQIEALREQL